MLVDDDSSHRGSVLSSRTLPSRMEDSFGDGRLDRFDRFEQELANISKKLEQETIARIKLQEIIKNSGISLPAEMTLPE